MKPLLLALLALTVFHHVAPAETRTIPDPLKPWVDWALWNNDHRNCPSPFNDPRKTLCTWPARLTIQAVPQSGRFDFEVTVYSESWLALPGGVESWPAEVKANGVAVPVLEQNKAPSIRLTPGTYRIEGTFAWNEIPQRIAIPSSIGILSLAVEGKPVENPSWDASGILWLKRKSSTEETDKNFLGTKIYAVLEDGIPLWLRTDIELIVSGKSREEEIGVVLPEGWKLASVESQIPVAIDAAGKLKAQVRAGKWTIQTSAFRTDNPTELRFAPEVKPAVADELIAFRSSPEFRLVDILGAPSVDVSQTTFPDKWRDLPVFRWETATPLRIEERLRGMGLQRPEGLRISREWWLDESGKQLTFRDRIAGTMQQIWRLDAAAGQNLGSVRNAGEGQLITRNPKDGAPGVEIRTRNIDLEAAGLMPSAKNLPATGWSCDADSLNVTLNLPPGWRLYALLGADWVRGDWLTAWTLLDLFVLLIFSLAVSRLWGPVAAILAFVAFALSYHEPNAPRYIWLALLIPLALLRVVHDGWGHRLLVLWKWATVVVLVFFLAPFVAAQVQQALYPQLEKLPGSMPRPMGAMAMTAEIQAAPAEASVADSSSRAYVSNFAKSAPAAQQVPNSNLAFDPKARIQTGPGVPDWSWRTVTFGWNGPVLASQQVSPILISLGVERALTVLRVILLLALTGLLLNARRWSLPRFGAPAAILMALVLLAPAPARAEFPSDALLNTLRDRLLEPDDSFPQAADISSAALTLADRKLTMNVEVACAIRTAVPLPGRLPTWSPLSVTVNGKPEATLRRADGFLWIVLPAGIHRVRVEGLLPDVSEWEWTFLLKPRLVKIEAPEWTYSGIRPNGVPDQQVFLARKQKSTDAEATYERQDLQNLVVVDRVIEMGLVWQVRTTVSRVSPPGRAVSILIPMLPGENVLTPNIVLRDGMVEARLAANDQAFVWQSRLPATPDLRLTTRADDAWIERWHLLASPVWNVSISGLAPIFESANPELVPVWHPWPGESADLAISRPEAISGATITVSKGTHEITVGARQRVAKLDLSLRCTVGEDFPITLPSGAEVTSLKQDGRPIPVRIESGQLIVPVRPGEQTLTVDWKEDRPLAFRSTAGSLRLPVESANITTIVRVPDNRWVLWTDGPLRGPAVRFWTVLVCSLLAAWALSRVRLAPLRALQWMLLAIGLTQVPLAAGLTVVAWLIFLEWRGHASFLALRPLPFNLLQIVLVLLTAATFAVFIAVVAEGLLGSPDMFISGNGSTRSMLQWYAAHSADALPTPGFFSVSIWWYRFLMLVWALWLAASLIQWLQWGWKQFSAGGCFRGGKKKSAPPELPTA